MLDGAGQQVGWQRRLCHAVLEQTATVHPWWQRKARLTVVGVRRVSILRQARGQRSVWGARAGGQGSARPLWCDHEGDARAINELGCGLEIRQVEF